MIALVSALTVLLASPDDYKDAWDKVSSAIRSNYYAREVRKMEMERILGEYSDKAKSATSRAAFKELMQQMIREFKDSHFDFLTRSDQGFYLMQGLVNPTTAEEMPEIGAWFAKVDTGYTIRMVLDGGEAARVGLRKGDVIEKIDDEDFTPVEALKSKVGSQVVLTVHRGWTTLTATVKVNSKPCVSMFLDATQASVKIVEDHGRKIGYVHLWTQVNDSFRNALSGAIYGKLKDTDGFILDLRDGFGGRPEGYGDPFFRPDYWIEWRSSPTSASTQLFGYGRPLVVLINGGSRSAKEILSYAFKKSRRGFLIGQTTAGNVLGTFPKRINDWSFIEIPQVDVTVQGTRLENHGVEPDFSLPSELDADGKDLDYQAALRKLRNVPLYKGDIYKVSTQVPALNASVKSPSGG
jgi:carboxyl-terminal processing protease